jgi:hypothetical protein
MESAYVYRVARHAFGTDDGRQLADIRRSDTIEAMVGGARVEKLANAQHNIGLSQAAEALQSG